MVRIIFKKSMTPGLFKKSMTSLQGCQMASRVMVWIIKKNQQLWDVVIGIVALPPMTRCSGVVGINDDDSQDDVIGIITPPLTT